MHVKPLKSGEKVTYQLIEATKKSPTKKTEDDEPLNNSPSWRSAKRTMVKDIETGELVEISCVVGTKPFVYDDGPNKGKTQMQDVLDVLKFNSSGVLEISDQDPFGMYQYAELHSANESNPFRDPNKPAKYFRLDAQKAAISESNKLLMKGEALAWIGSCDHIEIKAINTSLPDGFKLNMESDYEVIKAKLMELTDKDHIMVMKASNNKAAIAKITVMECEKYKIILWEEQSRKWFYNDEKMATIAEIEIGKNRYDGLVEVFKSGDEGKKLYKRLTTTLEKFLNLGRPN